MTWIDYFKTMLINWNCLNRKPTGNILDLYSLDYNAKKELINYLEKYFYSDENDYIVYRFAGNLIRIWK